jgi:hypothetical protein
MNRRQIQPPHVVPRSRTNTAANHEPGQGAQKLLRPRSSRLAQPHQLPRPDDASAFGDEGPHLGREIGRERAGGGRHACWPCGVCLRADTREELLEERIFCRCFFSRIFLPKKKPPNNECKEPTLTETHAPDTKTSLASPPLPGAAASWWGRARRRRQPRRSKGRSQRVLPRVQLAKQTLGPDAAAAPVRPHLPHLQNDIPSAVPSLGPLRRVPPPLPPPPPHGPPTPSPFPSRLCGTWRLKTWLEKSELSKDRACEPSNQQPAIQQLESLRRAAVYHVVNPAVMAAYERKKEELAARLGGANEQFLFHGTSLKNQRESSATTSVLARWETHDDDDAGVCVVIGTLFSYEFNTPDEDTFG